MWQDKSLRLTFPSLLHHPPKCEISKNDKLLKIGGRHTRKDASACSAACLISQIAKKRNKKIETYQSSNRCRQSVDLLDGTRLDLVDQTVKETNKRVKKKERKLRRSVEEVKGRGC